LILNTLFLQVAVAVAFAWAAAAVPAAIKQVQAQQAQDQLPYQSETVVLEVQVEEDQHLKTASHQVLVG
jgi:hypothetical protein